MSSLNLYTVFDVTRARTVKLGTRQLAGSVGVGHHIRGCMASDPMYKIVNVIHTPNTVELYVEEEV